VYQLDFGFKFPHVHPRVSADLMTPFLQPSTFTMRTGEVDIPLVGDASRPIQQLVARSPARGRPPFNGRRSYQYKIRFKTLDSHHDVWLSEKMIRTKHLDLAPDLIAECDAQYQSTGVPGRAYFERKRDGTKFCAVQNIPQPRQLVWLPE
jgi:hypothetical protein